MCKKVTRSGWGEHGACCVTSRCFSWTICGAGCLHVLFGCNNPLFAALTSSAPLGRFEESVNRGQDEKASALTHPNRGLYYFKGEFRTLRRPVNCLHPKVPHSCGHGPHPVHGWAVVWAVHRLCPQMKLFRISPAKAQLLSQKRRGTRPNQPRAIVLPPTQLYTRDDAVRLYHPLGNQRFAARHQAV